MKFGLLASVLCAGLVSIAAAAEKIEGGPKGGRLLGKGNPRPEFFVEKDKTVTITFYDAALKPVPAGEQSVTVIADGKKGKEKFEFEKKGETLSSKGQLPEGDGYNLVVQVSDKPGAKPQNYRFKYDTHTCGECKRAEYACICGDN